MDTHDQIFEPMNEVVWTKDGGKGCGMALVKLAGLSLLTIGIGLAAMRVGYLVIQAWWSL